MSYKSNLESLTRPILGARSYSGYRGMGELPSPLAIANPDGSCPDGYEHVYGNTCAYTGASQPAPPPAGMTCPQGQVGMPPMVPCVAVPGQPQTSPPQQPSGCPQGQVGWPNLGIPCVAVPGQPQTQPAQPAQPGACPAGQVGMPPMMPCMAIPGWGGGECPPGWTGTFPACQPTGVPNPYGGACLPGSQGVFPNCKPGVPAPPEPPPKPAPAPPGVLPPPEVPLTSKPWFLPLVLAGGFVTAAVVIHQVQKSQRGAR